MSSHKEQLMKKKYSLQVEGQHVLVLGGSGGIGEEIVRALAANGATAISFTYNRNRGKALALKKELAALKVKSFIFKVSERTDGSERKFKHMLENAVQAVGQEIDGMVDTIGISPNVPFEKQSIGGKERGREGWQRVFEVNVFGCFISTRAVASRMRDKGVKGSIVLIASDNATVAFDPLSAPYDASKAAQISIMHNVALWGSPYGIRCNTISPGWVDTHMNDTLDKKFLDKERSLIPLGRLLEPVEVATEAVHLLSPGASFVTGQDRLVNGGYPRRH